MKKNKKNLYHHGDLKNALIEKGIELINKDGKEKLSLRKVAKECGVSNAAPYAHFKNKDKMILEIRQYIINQFCKTLEETEKKYQKNTNDIELLYLLGKNYVLFFYKNPQYFDFLFSNSECIIDFTLENNSDKKREGLEILKNTAYRVFSSRNLAEGQIENKIIAMWSFVQGLAYMSHISDVKQYGNWENRIEEIIKSLSIL